ncbi:MAG TPA: replicative DNA helicase [Spirochaetes bacterium]|nr:replicative DNA helicase [Spirochaetota bacterium]
MGNQDVELLEKTPPQSLEAEKAVIASMLIDFEAIVKVADQISLDDFFQEAHQYILKSILDLYDKDEPVDLVTVNNSLKDQPLIIRQGGASYLDEIINTIPTSANVEYYVQIIKEKAELRKLISVCNEIISSAYQHPDSVSNLIDWAESKIFEIAERRIKADFVQLKPVLRETLNFIEQRYHHRDTYSGVPSGFTDLDDLTAGFQKSDLIIIAARPSMGKTALCLNITENIAMNYKKGVAFFSLEMSKQQLCQRLISSYSRFDSQKLRTGKLTATDFPMITNTVNHLSKAKIFLDDTPAINTLEIRAKARRLVAKEQIDLIIVDYLQLISLPDRSRSDNRQTEIAEISRSLKTLARELDIPIIALSQLSRMVETRGGDHRPKLSDLRDSGAIEQDADVVIFIYRNEYYHPDDEETKGKAEIIVSKQRNGPTGTLNLYFNSTQARFDNFTPYET